MSSFKCSICGASFLTKEKLNKHIAVIHMLKCDFCDTAFTSEKQLEMHIMKVMALPVMEFKDQGYKIRNNFA